MNNETEKQEEQEEKFVYEVEDETPVVEEKNEISTEKKVEEELKSSMKGTDLDD